jgi:hypothetical protein
VEISIGMADKIDTSLTDDDRRKPEGGFFEPWTTVVSCQHAMLYHWRMVADRVGRVKDLVPLVRAML